MTIEEIEMKWLMIKNEVDPVLIQDDELEEVGFLLSEVKRLREGIEKHRKQTREWDYTPINEKLYKLLESK